MPAGYLEPKRLPWSWAEARLEAARNYWVSSISSGGAPHVRPVWAVWLDGGLYFSSGSRIRTNLERHPAVSVNLESGDECVILEGRVNVLLDEPMTRRVAVAYSAKYHWDMQPKPGEFLELKPRRAFGWVVDGSGLDGGALFSATSTRWVFE
jgi:nitroimidazol reductase NimA-like FMN-containing flavoprotein (pyridoxamine 5'-phosphate oxidase superfamily)